jgi:hypothetical protein
MDLQTLQTKVQTSRLLTEAERAYWLQNIPRMTPEQLKKLETILTEAEGLQWNQEMQQYLSIANKTGAALAAAA